MNPADIRTFFDSSAWATDRILDQAAHLMPDCTGRRERTTGGSRGRGTMGHDGGRYDNNDRLLVALAWARGGFYLATGIWPLVSIGSFRRVAGPKADTWLVKMAGALITAGLDPVWWPKTPSGVPARPLVAGQPADHGDVAPPRMGERLGFRPGRP